MKTNCFCGRVAADYIVEGGKLTAKCMECSAKLAKKPQTTQEVLADVGIGHTVQNAFSELLGALGYTRMAQEVLVERDHSRLTRYAEFILKGAPIAKRFELKTLFIHLGFF
jgi:hypothetical protein